ncbi:Two component response regulator [Magnetospirillum sp. LM-5]|uniref:winged helix-turn-helix transcriptional regulator n=1 Tax=Magnetospirillum sp. LM-5 TaxID=2681466 RepID=UPI0013809F4E|nr:winged helix-turn-helix domain-containing protein [Magnetospirillum sp. LM-5]CAA7622732.1 Two component response regulator [Magnetospirillum sp. LM-5]
MKSTPLILLIDDDSVVRDTLAEVLRNAGHAVASTDGTGALPAADLVVAATAPTDGSLAWVALTKPVRVAPLLAAVTAALARREACRVRFGGWCLDAPGRMLVHQDGHRVRLTDKEAAILSLLAKADGAVDRQTLLAEVWGYGRSVTTHTLETHIYRLRRKIEADPDGAALLLTEPGGYRLIRTEES